MFKKFFLVLVVLAALLVVAIKFLPWWASLLLILAILLGLRYGVGYAMKRLLTIPFKAKGKVLANATVRVHQVELAPVPDVHDEADLDGDEGDEDEPAADLQWYFLDLKITPREQSASFPCWEPGELLFTGMEAKPNSIETDETICEVHDYQILEEGRFVEDERGKHEGAQRIKFHVGLPREVQNFQLRYYFELFGKIKIPSSLM